MFPCHVEEAASVRGTGARCLPWDAYRAIPRNLVVTPGGFGLFLTILHLTTRELGAIILMNGNAELGCRLTTISTVELAQA